MYPKHLQYHFKALSIITKHSFKSFSPVLDVFDIINHDRPVLYNTQILHEMLLQNLVSAFFYLYTVFTYRIYLSVSAYSSLKYLVNVEDKDMSRFVFLWTGIPKNLLFHFLISLTFAAGYNSPTMFFGLQCIYLFLVKNFLLIPVSW